jgi:vanillate O-demethylase monooxygenase subunit
MLRCESRYGLIWVCLEDPVTDIPSFPEWEMDNYRHVPCPAYRWKTSAERMVENFTDFGHLGYLHDGLLGTRDNLVVPPHHVEQSGLDLRYAITMEVPNTNRDFAVTKVKGERGLQTNTYVLTLPYSIYLECRYHDTDAHRTLFFTVQPHGNGTSTGYCYQSRDFDLDSEDAPYADFQEVLAAQDQPIVESQIPHEVPDDINDELHLPFDRVALSYRRAMSQLRRPDGEPIDKVDAMS